MSFKKLSTSNLKRAPWYIARLGSVSNLDIITSSTVPESVSDQKVLDYVDVAVPGSHTTVPKFGGMKARRLSFTLRIAEFNDVLGITPKVSQFRTLRQPQPSIGGFGPLTPVPFTPNPKVAYAYGASSALPLVYYCVQVGINLSYPNKIGNPQVADISIELVLDEEHPLYRAERLWMQTKARLGTVKSLTEPFAAGNPYKGRGLI